MECWVACCEIETSRMMFLKCTEFLGWCINCTSFLRIHFFLGFFKKFSSLPDPFRATFKFGVKQFEHQRNSSETTMLKQHISGPVTADIERAIRDILKDDAKYVLTEMRSRHRENLVVPVNLILPNDQLETGFTRNISSAGVCIITENPIEEGVFGDLEIYRLNGNPVTISSDARWCRPFGRQYFMSGWKFNQLK